MNTLRGTICLWLCLMYARVECWPKVRLSSRQEKDEGAASVTILYLIDTTVNATDENVETFIAYVNTQAEQFLESFFDLKTILNNRTKYVKHDPGLKKLMEQNNNGDFIYTDGTIYNLTSYYSSRTRPDIICLVTGRRINNGDDVKKGYGYSTHKTLCETAVTMLLAYNLEHHNDISKMLAEMVRDSVDPKKVPYVHQQFDNLTDSMKNYLSQCNGSFEQEMPPDVPPKPTPEAPGTPGTPLPPGPPPPPSPPGPPQPPPEATTTAEPELPKPNPPQPPVPPETPEAPSSTEGPTSTTTLNPDYC
ncbi:acrosin-like [Ixodes scapularis]|uniref:acrosin-like n=1 Tax=Ixodes scapularis TaxID=6945 RepID=UPI001C38D9D9|nr:acrosin-like [Ixodes scapularis]